MTEELEKVLKNPITTHALVELMLERGIKVSVENNKLTHDERVKLVRFIYEELEKRELWQ